MQVGGTINTHGQIDQGPKAQNQDHNMTQTFPSFKPDTNRMNLQDGRKLGDYLYR